MLEVLNLINVNKSFSNRKILNDISFNVYKNDMLAITGKSGSGKTSLLNIIGLLEKPDSGIIKIFGKEIANISNKERGLLLRKNISYLFQNFALIDNESVSKNLDIPLVYSKIKNKEKNELKNKVITKVGLNCSLNKKVYELSGGEQQRLAIARILLKPCDIIIADEPTGSLDNETKKEIMILLKALNKDGKTIIIVTHDDYVVKQCNRIFKIEDGKLVQ